MRIVRADALPGCTGINGLRMREAVISMLLIALCAFPMTLHAFEGPPSRRYPDVSGDIGVPLLRVAVLDLFAYTGLVALWPSAFGPGQGSAAQFKSNFHNPPSWSSTTPFWNADGDPAFINIGLHALYGSEAYLAFRSRRHGVPASFAFAVVQTFVWEYFIEGPFHAPSLIDLVWTPFAGAVLGELRLQLLLLIERRMRPGALKSALMFVLDPLGTVERAACHCRLSSD